MKIKLNTKGEFVMFINSKKVIVLVILLSLLTILSSCQSLKDSDNLSVHIIDVNQGDSILIITPNDKTILIDGGDPSEGENVITYLKRHGVKRINLLVGTHPHADHIGGLIDVIEYFPIDEFYLSPKIHTTKTYEKLLLAADKKRLHITPVDKSFRIAFDDSITLHFITPIKDYENDLNLWSIVMKMDYMNQHFLFTGDTEAISEKDMINLYGKALFKSNVLKVAHHGSSTSSSQEFLEAVQPEIAVISCGRDNSYGFPHKETLERLSKFNLHLFRTDYQGTIILESDGQKIWSHKKPYRP